MRSPQLRKKLQIGGGVLLVIGFIFLSMVLNERVTTWVNSDRFRDKLNQETSKGLKLEGQYSALVRTGLLSLHADSFDGVNGRKTIVSLHVRDISWTFN